jgi:hypothetical protein
MMIHARETQTTNYAPFVGLVMLMIALVFVWRSFYAMRIPVDPELSLTKPGKQDAIADLEEVGV